jgi:hypothetical protein
MGRENRLHDRLRYRRGDRGEWVIERLSRRVSGMSDDYGPATYGDRIAGIYDQWVEDADRRGPTTPWRSSPNWLGRVRRSSSASGPGASPSHWSSAA